MALAEAGNITYRVLDSVPEIEAISGEWDLLLDQSPCNRAFSCSKWFLVSCSLNQSISPRVVVARRGDVIAGVFPLVLVDDTGIATFASELSDYNDIVALENDRAVLAGLLEYAISSADGCKRVILSRVRRDSNCLRAARALRPADDFDQLFKGSCQYIRLSSSYEEYLRTRSRNFRKSLSRARRIAEDYNLTIRQLEPESFPPSRLPEAFLSLNLDRWGAESYYRLPFPQSFVLKILPDLFSEGRMRVFALMKDERLLGLDLCMIGKNSLCTWNGGFLSETEQWSPGNLLIAAGIKQAYAMNLEEYDLLRGDESYKKRWANSIRPIGRLEFDAQT